jgi:PAS domain-containing protein
MKNVREKQTENYNRGLIEASVSNSLANIFGYSRDEMLATPGSIMWADPDERKEMIRVLQENHRVDHFPAQIKAKIQRFMTHALERESENNGI